jgi:four helix bundle protein
MQNAKCKMQSDARSDLPKLDERLLDFAVAAVRLVNAFPGTVTGRHIGGQLMRAGTSAAANYEEACAGESRADFLHKMQLALTELREARFWLRLTSRTGLAAGPECQDVLQEAEELCNIVAKSVVTARSRG